MSPLKSKTSNDAAAFDTSSVREILTIVFKRKMLIIVTFLVAFAFVTIFAFGIKPSYEAKARLMVKFGREFISSPEVGVEGRSVNVVSPANIVNTEIQILTSKELVAKVIDAIGLNVLYPGLSVNPKQKITTMDLAATYFLENLEVKPIPNSNLISLSFKYGDPQKAVKILDLLISLYKEKHLEVFSSAGSAPFLQKQLEGYEKKLKESEISFEKFKQKHGIFSVEDQRNALLAQQRELEASYRTTLGQVAEVEQKLSFVKSGAWTPETLPETRTMLLALKQKERELTEKYNENNRFVQNVRSEMKAVLDDLRKAEIDRLNGELRALQGKKEIQGRQLNNITGQAYALDSRNREFQELKRDVVQQDANYQSYSKRVEESLIMNQMDIQKMANISVVDAPSIYLSPIHNLKRKSTLLPLGFAGGIILGFVLAFLVEVLSPTMVTPHAVEKRLGIPVLVSIPFKDNLPRY